MFRLRAPPGLSHGEIVSALYRAMLGREPDPGGLAHFAGRLGAGVALADVVRDFLASPEFKPGKVVSLGPLDALPANRVELALSDAEREALWRHVAGVWAGLGRAEPYWSVLVSDEFRATNMSQAERIDRFYGTGEWDVERLERYLARHGRGLPKQGTCVDYGCGVGRVTLWLARRCRRVLALDVSEAHLALARDNLAARGVGNVEFHRVRSRSDLDAMRGADLFHSILVLQHNPPPLIVDILGAAFTGLAPGGTAFFQVPTYAVDYAWDLPAYLAEIAPKERMEMHVLPQQAIFALAAAAACAPLEAQPDHCVGMPTWISNTFVVAGPSEKRV